MQTKPSHTFDYCLLDLGCSSYAWLNLDKSTRHIDSTLSFLSEFFRTFIFRLKLKVTFHNMIRNLSITINGNVDISIPQFLISAFSIYVETAGCTAFISFNPRCQMNHIHWLLIDHWSKKLAFVIDISSQTSIDFYLGDQNDEVSGKNTILLIKKWLYLFCVHIFDKSELKL